MRARTAGRSLPPGWRARAPVVAKASGAMTGKFTVKEALTAIVVLVVIAAVALPMWRTHQLKIRREDAANALRAVQVAQDDFFALHARYANEAQLRLAAPDSAFGSVVSATT